MKIFLLKFLFVLIIFDRFYLSYIAGEERPLYLALENPVNTLDFSNIIYTAIWIFALFVVLIFIMDDIYFRKKNQIFSFIFFNSPIRWYFLFGIFAIVSSLYSISKIYTLFMAIRIIIAIILTLLIILETKNLASCVNILLKVYVFKEIIIFILFIISPSLVGTYTGNYYRLTGGIFPDYGLSASISIIFFLEKTLKGKDALVKGANLLGFIFSFFMVLSSRTRHIISATCIIIIFLTTLILKTKKRIIFIVVLSILCLIFFMYSGTIINDIYLFFVRDPESIRNLSYRTVLFDYCIQKWKKSPYIGYGYMAGSRKVFSDLWESSGIRFGLPHDALSQALIDLGILGTLPLVISFYSSWKYSIFLLKIVKKKPELTTIIVKILCLLILVSVTSLFSNVISTLSISYVVILVTTSFLMTFVENLKTR